MPANSNGEVVILFDLDDFSLSMNFFSLLLFTLNQSQITLSSYPIHAIFKLMQMLQEFDAMINFFLSWQRTVLHFR